jgi:hypothetical protein
VTPISPEVSRHTINTHREERGKKIKEGSENNNNRYRDTEGQKKKQ